MHPILFQFGPITVYSLWFLIAIGFVIANVVFFSIAKKNRVKVELIYNNSFSVFLLTIISARIFFILENWQFFFFDYSVSEFFSIFAVWDKGLSVWGMVIGLIYSLVRIAKKNSASVLPWLDSLIIALLSGFICGNIGAFFEGINYGKETTMPWGVTFESGVVKYAVPIHPTQIYAALYCGLIVAILWNLRKRKFGREAGNITVSGVGLYSAFFLIETFFRGDDTFLLFDLVRIDQVYALIALILSGIYFFRKYKKPTNDSQEKAS